jgi:hypothetical protein
VDEDRMKSREFVPLERRPGRPYIESGGQVTYRERGSPDQVVVSLSEGETSKLVLQRRPSYPSISARPGIVVIMVLFPRRSMAWCGATVPVVTALSARWWFTNHPERCEHVMAFVIISHSSWGVVALVWEQVPALGSSAASLVLVPVASILGCGVEVPGGLASLESQGHGLVPHPIVGGAIHSSCRGVFR